MIRGQARVAKSLIDSSTVGDDTSTSDVGAYTLFNHYDDVARLTHVSGSETNELAAVEYTTISEDAFQFNTTTTVTKDTYTVIRGQASVAKSLIDSSTVGPCASRASGEAPKPECR